MRSTMFGLLLAIAVVAPTKTFAWHACNGGGLCPDGNTCCPTIVNGVSACISTKNDTLGACCMDTVAGTTGCGDGFECAYDKEKNLRYCLKVDANKTDKPDRLPRYHPCSVPDEAFTQVHGLPILSYNSTAPQLAYLSTMGALDSSDPNVLSNQSRVKTLLVMVHGSGRNVEDYLCSANAALPPSQQDPASSRMMVVAPWFLALQDGQVELFNRSPGTEALRWSEFGPIFHTWRYGADAVNSELVNANISVSSYAVMDVLLEHVLDSVERFPNLRRIVLAGHSAGGQYTQRWALLSNSRAFASVSNGKESSSHVPTRVVVANPRSFCFLDERRMINGTFRAPDAATASDCDWYNQWEWGLGPGDALDTPYKTLAVKEAGGNDAIVRRYPYRDIVYLAGEQDIVPNGDCQDKLQGPFRRLRSEHFFESLRLIYSRPVHHRLVVSGVPHDHSLMFQSPEGQEAMFGALGETYLTTA